MGTQDRKEQICPMKIQITFPRISTLAMTCCFLFLTRAFLVLPSESSPSIPEPGPSGEGQTSFPLTKADLNTDPGSGSMIDLSQLSDDYTITQAGTYILTGEYNGQISVDAEEQIVHLYLKDVSIHSRSGPAILVNSAGKVVITLAEGTDNIIRDSAHYRGSDNQDASIYSSCDLTINGSGALSLYGYYNDALHSRDTVKILGGDIFLQSSGHGIQGNDGILISAGSLRIESKKSGLRTTKSGKDDRGTIDLCGGQISVIAGEYSIVSSGDLYVRNCSVRTDSVLGQLDVAGSRFLTAGCLEDE